MTTPATAPISPADAVREALDRMGWKQGELAEMWGLSQGAVSNLTTGRRGISPLMALRLEATLGGAAEQWLDLQRDWDLARLRESMGREMARIELRRQEMGL